MRAAFRFSLLFFAFLLASAQPLQACGVCVMSIFDAMMPPIFLWCAFATAWYLALCMILQRAKVNTTLFGFPMGIFISLGLWFICLGLIGPPAVLFLLLASAWRTVVYAASSRKLSDKSGKKAMLVVSTIAVICTLSLAGYSVYLLNTRTEVDYMMRWPGSPITRGKVNRMIKEGPINLPVFRQLAIQGPPYIIYQVAPAFANWGEPQVDVPILIDSLLRVNKDSGGQTWEMRQIEESINKLAGMNIAIGSSPDEWAKAWKKTNEMKATQKSK